MTLSDGLSDAERSKIIGLTRVLFPHAKIFLYGSRVRGDYRPESDIVDLHSLTGAMKENVEKEKILWSN